MIDKRIFQGLAHDHGALRRRRSIISCEYTQGNSTSVVYGNRTDVAEGIRKLQSSKQLAVIVVELH